MGDGNGDGREHWGGEGDFHSTSKILLGKKEKEWKRIFRNVFYRSTRTKEKKSRCGEQIIWWGNISLERVRNV